MNKTRTLAAAVFVAVGLIAAAPSSYAAGGGYGSGNGPAGVPGGYATVVTTHTFSSDGGSLVANIPGGQAQLTVPAGAFIGALQIAVTVPDLGGVEAALRKLGLGNHRVVAAVGIGVSDTNGHKFTGTFAHPLSLTIKGAALGVGDKVIQFTGPSTTTAVAATVSPGAVTVSMLADPDFAVLAPTSAVAALPVVSPTATAPATTSSAAAAAPASSAAARAAASSAPPTQVLGEAFTSSSRGVSGIAIMSIIAIVALFGAFIVAVRRRYPVRGPAEVAYAGKHVPKPAAYAKRHGARLATHAPRH